VNTAIDIKNYSSTSNGERSTVIDACELGAKVSSEFSPEIDSKDALVQLKDGISRTAYWREKASQCGLGGTLPNCYRDNPSEPQAYILNLTINDSGIQLEQGVPEKYRERYQREFPAKLPVGVTLSDQEFSRQTSKFLAYGEKRDCRFYVRVCDRTGEFQKRRYKDSLQAIEGHFYKFPTCSAQAR
jgi:hypothetical protein